VTIGTK